MRELQKIVAPRLEYKSLRDEYRTAHRRLPVLRTCFPDYDENEEYLPQKQYFWNVYHTLDPEFVTKYVERLNRWQSKKPFEEEKDLISIRQDIFAEITKSFITSSNFSLTSGAKGRAVYMLKDDFSFSKKQSRKKKRAGRSDDPSANE